MRKPSFQQGQVIYIHVVTMQLIRSRVLIRILKTEVIESIPGKKLGVKTKKLEFDPKSLAFFMRFFIRAVCIVYVCSVLTCSIFEVRKW